MEEQALDSAKSQEEEVPLSSRFLRAQRPFVGIHAGEEQSQTRVLDHGLRDVGQGVRDLVKTSSPDRARILASLVREVQERKDDSHAADRIADTSDGFSIQFGLPCRRTDMRLSYPQQH
jgi:hypothetical protein